MERDYLEFASKLDEPEKHFPGNFDTDKRAPKM